MIDHKIYLHEANFSFNQGSKCVFALKHSSQNELVNENCKITTFVVTNLYSKIPIYHSKTTVDGIAFEALKRRFGKFHIKQLDKSEGLIKLFWFCHGMKDSVEMKECKRLDVGLLEMVFENRADLKWPALKNYFQDCVENPELSKLIELDEYNLFNKFVKHPKFDHPFILWIAALIFRNKGVDHAYAFLLELAKKKEIRGLIVDEHLLNEAHSITKINGDEQKVKDHGYFEQVTKKHPIAYLEWKAKKLFICEKFEETIGVLLGSSNSLTLVGTILLALAHYYHKKKSSEGIEFAVRTLEKVQEGVRDSRWKLLKWKLDSEMHPEWMQLDAKKNTQPDQGAEDWFNSLVKFCKEFKSGFLALMLGIILTIIRFKNIFWSIFTSRNTHHTNLLTNIKKMQQFVDRIFQPKHYQNPPNITEILPLIEKTAIGLAQLNEDCQSRFLAHQEIVIQQIFHMGFSSSDQKVRHIALTTFKNLAKDYRRCGYGSKWYSNLIIDISADFHTNWSGTDNRSQLLNAVWINDSNILLDARLLHTEAYYHHGWKVWRYVHEYVMRQIN